MMRVVPARQGLWIEVASNLASIIAVVSALVKLLAKMDSSFMSAVVVFLVLLLVFCVVRLLHNIAGLVGYYDLRSSGSSFSARVRALEAQKPKMGGQMTQQVSGGNPLKMVLPYLRSERRTFEISQCQPFRWRTYHWRELDSDGCYFTHMGKPYMIVAYNKLHAEQNYEALPRQ